MRSALTSPAPVEWDERLKRLASGRRVQVLVSGLAQTQMVVGWLRPIVLLPVGVLTGFPADQIEALLLHELAHIRRHDYLVNLLQSVVECLLFYHPAVWWISAKVRAYREMCCDDDAVRAAGGDVLTYARALTALAASRRVVPGGLVMAGSGGPLALRIGRLLGSARPMEYRLQPGLVVGVACLIHAGLFGQLTPQAGPVLKFEVASIKASEADSGLNIAVLPGERLVVTHATLRFLIKIAYDLNDSQILGGPGWLSSKRFDVQAKPEDLPKNLATDKASERNRQRLQNLLAERFHLQLRNTTKDLDLFALVIGKNGHKLSLSKPSGAPHIPQRQGTPQEHGHVRGVPVRGSNRRPVVNMTGLRGDFDLQLEWTPETGLAPPDPSAVTIPSSDMGPTLFTALQEQLGLKLEARKSTANCVFLTNAVIPVEN